MNETQIQANKLTKNEVVKKINERVLEESENFADVIEILVEDIEQLGIKLSFTGYPNVTSETVSNSHNAPKGYPQNWRRGDDKPKGYPGVHGRWGGKVELIDNSYFKSVPSFSVITSLFPFIKTGSGTTGQNFGVSGMMFVYDFPKIKELYEQDIDAQVSLLSNQYCNKIMDIGKKHDNLRREYIRSNEKMHDIETALSELRQLTSDLTKAKMDLEIQLGHKFNAENKLKLDKAPQHFIHDDPRHELICANSSTHSNEEMVLLAEQANTIKKKMDEIISNFPENFI